MGRHLSAEELKIKHIEQMGEDLGSLFQELWNEVAWLNLKWNEYLVLFGHDDPNKGKSRIGLLNKSASTFFGIVQKALWENILLHIACITDDSRTCGKDNLSIKRLKDIVHQEIKEIIAEQISEVEEKTSFCRDWRNRHIAHRDFNLAMGEKVKPLEKASRKKVQDALEDIAKVMNTVSMHYAGMELRFNLIPVQNGAESLLYVLDDGIKAEINRRERIVKGKYLPEDLENRDL